MPLTLMLTSLVSTNSTVEYPKDGETGSCQGKHPQGILAQEYIYTMEKVFDLLAMYKQ